MSPLLIQFNHSPNWKVKSHTKQDGDDAVYLLNYIRRRQIQQLFLASGNSLTCRQYAQYLAGERNSNRNLPSIDL